MVQWSWLQPPPPKYYKYDPHLQHWCTASQWIVLFVIQSKIPMQSIYPSFEQPVKEQCIMRRSFMYFLLFSLCVNCVGLWLFFWLFDWKAWCFLLDSCLLDHESYSTMEHATLCFDLVNLSVIFWYYLTFLLHMQSYASILYLRLPDGFRIILRGKDIEHHNIVNDMMLKQEVKYRPQPGPDGIQKDPSVRHLFF